ncbi:MAG TPA: hypothetical protein VK660_00195 [Xanthomonadaceae bacterium]|nr:hypothetical protein [Xanthomonadaceae bacterium]
MKRLVRLTALALVLAAPSIAGTANGTLVNGSIHLRGAPSWSASLSSNVTIGTRITIAGCTDRWDWCEIEVAGDRGWVPASYLMYDLLGQQVPVPAYTKRTGLPVIGGDTSSGKSQETSKPAHSTGTQSHTTPATPTGKQSPDNHGSSPQDQSSSGSH